MNFLGLIKLPEYECKYTQMHAVKCELEKKNGKEIKPCNVKINQYHCHFWGNNGSRSYYLQSKLL